MFKRTKHKFTFEEKIELIKKYEEETGQLVSSKTFYEGQCLGNFLNRFIVLIKEGRLNPEKIDLLLTSKTLTTFIVK